MGTGERLLATGSLVLSIATLGTSPNAGSSGGKVLEAIEDVAENSITGSKKAGTTSKLTADDAGGGEARFVVEPNGTVVDTDATPRGSFDQPDGGRTDVLQREDHGAGLSHTHDPKVNTNPETGETFVNGLEKPGRPVSKQDVDNIQSGAATRSKPKGR